MKKFTATLLASSLLGLAAYAQGTLNFVNAGGGVNAPIYMNDGSTKLGTGFTAELFAGSSSANMVSVASTGFLSGGGAGYFQGGVVTLASIAPGATATLQLRVWATSSGSYAAASAANLANTWGQSSIFTVATGGVGSPPSTPSALTGLTSFNLNAGGVIPEPSSLALAGLGAAAMLVFRRRK